MPTTRTGRTTPILPAALWVVLGLFPLAACGAAAPTPGGTSPASASGTPAPTVTTVTPAPSATETEAATPFSGMVDTVTADPSNGAALTVTNVRVASHEGYDRVVFDLGGTGTPGWRVGYVQAAVDDPSGLPLQVRGAGILQVVISGTRYPSDTGQQEWKGSPLLPQLPVLQEVQVRGVFEGQTQAFLGVLHSDAPFRVFALAAPARLVIDIQG